MALPDDPRDLLLIHNPRCSKSRMLAGILAESDIAFRERRYLEDPLTLDELRDLRRRLGLPAREWARRREAAWREAALGRNPDDDAILAAMAAHPILIERPILVVGPAAVVGRPPEIVFELLEPGA